MSEALRRFAQLTGERFGLRVTPERLGPLLAERAALSGTVNIDYYVDWLSSDEADPDWAWLVRRLIVSESRFYRDPHCCREWADSLLPELVATREQNDIPLRIWSAGCATGEEPYTVAMLLSEAGLGDLCPPGSILATDVVDEFLQRARMGTFQARNARDMDEQRVARFFRRNGEVYTLRDRIKNSVRFEPLNLADENSVATFIQNHGPFDLILCRNVLGALLPPVAERLLEQFASALENHGRLLLGAQEAAGTWCAAFDALALGETVTFRPRPTDDAGNPQLPRESAQPNTLTPPPDNTPANT